MTTERRPLIVGNWKMNVKLEEGRDLAKNVALGAEKMCCDLVICPSTIFLQSIVDLLSPSDIAIGAQDCHAGLCGAHTGDVSAPMIADIGCKYVIVGHSERRINHGEDDVSIRAKCKAAHSVGLTAIVCVGESRAERDSGLTITRISSQLENSVPVSGRPCNTVIAYEPIWAIGSGQTPMAEEVSKVHVHIRTQLKLRHGESMAKDFRIIYGGSVNPSNSNELLRLKDVDGALVGGASLNAESFLEIARACSRIVD